MLATMGSALECGCCYSTGSGGLANIHVVDLDRLNGLSRSSSLDRLGIERVIL